MELENLKDTSEQVTFAEAVKKGLGKNQGLFFPKKLPKFADIDSILAMPFKKQLSILLPNDGAFRIALLENL